MTLCRLSVRLRCERRRKMRNPDLFPSVTVSLRCSVFSLARVYSPHTVRGCVATSKHISSIPACLQLVSSDRWLLIFLHGSRVRHEPFSYCRTVKLQLDVEKHFQWTSSLSSVVHLPTLPAYLTSMMIRTLLTTFHHRIVCISLRTHPAISH